MSRFLLWFRPALALALVLSVAVVAPADDTKKSGDPKKKKAAGTKKKAGAIRLVAMDSTDISGYPKLAVTSKPGQRSRQQLEAVLAQFKVQSNKRFLPRQGRTFCNIYARDVSYAMGVKLPWMLANNLYDWLPSQAGQAAGWVPVSPDEAQQAANEGRPVVVSFKNTAKVKVKGRDGKVRETPAHGHIAIVRPGPLTGGPFLSNAGSKNLANVPVSKVFSAARMQTIKYYANK